MFLGLRSVIYPAPDMDAAKEWYTRALEVEPYFEAEAYVGYSLGGYELGLFKFGDPEAGPQSYWGVADITVSIGQLIEAGAKQAEATHDVGQGILMASVTDPMGQPIGLIETPVFKIVPVPQSGSGR